MNAAQLLHHFERISEAPEAVARLRRFILNLAVRVATLQCRKRHCPHERRSTHGIIIVCLTRHNQARENQWAGIRNRRDRHVTRTDYRIPLGHIQTQKLV